MTDENTNKSTGEKKPSTDTSSTGKVIRDNVGFQKGDRVKPPAITNLTEKVQPQNKTEE